MKHAMYEDKRDRKRNQMIREEVRARKTKKKKKTNKRDYST